MARMQQELKELTAANEDMKAQVRHKGDQAVG